MGLPTPNDLIRKTIPHRRSQALGFQSAPDVVGLANKNSRHLQPRTLVPREVLLLPELPHACVGDTLCKAAWPLVKRPAERFSNVGTYLVWD